MAGFTREELQSYARGKRGEFEGVLEKIVEIPSVSVDPARKGDVHRAARIRRVASRVVRGEGRNSTRRRATRSSTAASTAAPSYPTVTVYNHLDVQPAEGPDWNTEPFDFIREGDKYRGRGTTDDKGPAITALFGARYALEQGVPLNIHFLWELEEEIGSPHFETTIRANAKDVRDGLGRRLRHGVGLARAPGLPGRPARPAGLALRARRRARPTSTPARPAARRATRSPSSASSSPSASTGRPARSRSPASTRTSSRRRRRSSRTCKKCGFTVEGLQEGPPLPVAARQRRARSHEADLDDADLRGPRHRRRLPGPGRQDDHPAARPRRSSPAASFPR